ncbi:MAG: hypothetical protein JOY80_10565 [Candidatus Dormibacteraeota bacterium]|nr:hypothetical protein [Candidatus Dormibacteraeota bacterium]
MAALAIIVDDAHWADASTLEALQHVAAGLSDERLLLWVNARGGADPAQELSARLRRTPAAREIHLRGLGSTAVRDQLALLTGATVSDSDLQQAHSVTGGNPFLVNEYARGMVDRRIRGSQPGPSRGFVGELSARLAQLAPPTSAALRAAAILGNDFDSGLLASMLDATADDLAARLDDARRAGMVEPVNAPGRQRFIHALVRDGVEAGTDAAEQARLHRRAALAIEERHALVSRQELFALAAHWSRAAIADDAARAAMWVERAGDAAMAQLAHEEAQHLYAEALLLGGGALHERARFRLQLSQAAAAERRGALGACCSAMLAAAALARSCDDDELLTQAALAMEPTGAASFDLAIRRLCQEALERLGPDPTPRRARLLARFAETYIYLPNPDAARAASLEAVRIADLADDVAATAAAIRARQVVIADPDGLDEREQLMARLAALGEMRGDAALEMPGRLGLVDAALERGDLGHVAFELEAARRCATELGGPFARFKVLQVEAVLAQAQGRFDDCRRGVAAALNVMRQIDHHEPALMRGAVLSALARHAGHDSESLAATGLGGGLDVPDPEVLASAGMVAALSAADACVVAGRLEQAAGFVVPLVPAESWRPPPHVALMVPALGLDVAIVLGRRDDVVALHARLANHREHCVTSGLIAAAFYGPVELWIGKASRYLGRLDEAVADLDHAAQCCARWGLQGFGVEAEVELATALATRGRGDDPARARTLLTAAAHGAARLGMTPWSARIDELVSKLNAQRAGPLSHREMEIAELVAEGLTNRQIAKRLFLSDRTAQNHVQHILDKLGLDNRSQIAVWADRARGTAPKTG